MNALPHCLLQEAEVGTEQASGAHTKHGQGCKTRQLYPGSHSRAAPHLLSEISPAAHLWVLQLKAVRGAWVHVQLFYTNFQSLMLVGLTQQESADRGLLASLHHPLTPSSHLCLMLSLLCTTEVRMQFYIAEPSES